MATKSSSGANEPSLEAAQFGAALKRLVEPYASSLTGSYLAKELKVSPSKMSRLYSGKYGTVASKKELNQIIGLVREAAARTGASVPDSVVRDLHRLRQRAQGAAETSSKKADLLTGRVRQLDAELRESRKRVEALKAQVAEAEAARAAEAAAYGAALEAGSRELAGLREQLARAEADQGRLHAAAQKDKAEITALRAALERAETVGEAKAADINAALADSRSTLRALRDKLEAAETANARLQREAAALMQDLRRAEDQAAHWRRTAVHAESGAQEAISRLQKQLQAAAEYGRDSDALIEEQLQLLAERESDNQRLRSEVRALERLVRSYRDEEEARARETIAGAAMQVTTPTAAPESRFAGDTTWPRTSGAGASAGSSGHRQPSPGSPADDDSWALGLYDGADATLPFMDATPTATDEEDTGHRLSPVAFRLKLVWDAVLALVGAQMVSFTILAFRVMAASGKTPHSRDIICWGGAVVISLGIIFLGWLFSVSDKTAQALPALLLVCALTAGFGSTVFTIPAVSDLAHTVGVEMAARADGKSCDLSFCQTG